MINQQGQIFSNLRTFSEVLQDKFERFVDKNQSKIEYFNIIGNASTYLRYQKGDDTTNINGEFKDKYGCPIMCTQIAMHNLTYVKDDEICDIQGLKEGYYNLQSQRLKSNALVLVSLNKIGVGLSHIATTYNSKPSFKIIIIMNSENHAMRIEFSKKTEPERYKIKFIDSNSHHISQNLIVENTQQLQKITIEDFLLLPQIECYFPKYNYAMLCVYEDIDKLKMPLHQEFTIYSNSQNNSDKAMQIYFAIQFCVADDQIILLLQDTTESDKLELLTYKNNNGASILYVAMQDDNIYLVELFTDTILDSSTLLDKTKVALLACKIDDGIGGLLIAMQNDNADLVESFIETILDSTLPDKDKVELLACKNNDGIGGLFMAMQNDNADLVESFIETILDSILPDKDKVELLACKNNDGESGLLTATEEENIDLVELFKKVISGSKLSPTDKEQLMKT